MEMATGLMWQVRPWMYGSLRMVKIFILFVGTVIGDNYGLARKATAIAVRVLNDNGSGSFA